jgi:trehalose/maltose transport system substrate-binding protein
MTSAIEPAQSIALENCVARRAHFKCGTWARCAILLVLLAQGCGRTPVRQPVTLVYLDQRLVNPMYQTEYKREFEQFTRETGIVVKPLPHPESTQDQLALWQRLLNSGSSGPDVYGIDVVWPAILVDDLVDLKPYFADEIPEFFPPILKNFTANGKLVAIPEGSDIGLLFYRSDLLQRYGYRRPPGSWDELETMAARIKAGERARGDKKFWGFVWSGIATEALTCAALEWQASQGGGRIIEEDGTISVNNAKAIKAWERAARWVGTISSPSVVAYSEYDSSNAWSAGEAAFLRSWPPAYNEAEALASFFPHKVGVALLPGGEGGHVGTLGGIGLGVSRHSAHQHEAIELVRFLTSPDMAAKRARLLSDPPSMPALYGIPQVLAPNPHFTVVGRALVTGIVLRPSDATGKNYDKVSEAYSRAVHSVLTHERSAPEAAAALEKELVHITGLRPGPPLNQPTDRLGRHSPDERRADR